MYAYLWLMIVKYKSKFSCLLNLEICTLFRKFSILYSFGYNLILLILSLKMYIDATDIYLHLYLYTINKLACKIYIIGVKISL